MDFSWTQQQKDFFAKIEAFATRELNLNLIDNDRLAVFNEAGWRKCAAMGIHGLVVPTQYGGQGLDPLTTVGALERLGYGCRDNGLVFSINAHMWTACAPILAFGSEEQKRQYLPGLCGGQWVGANCITEPGSGSDAFSMGTTAVKQGDKYILNGVKTFITNGPRADVLVVFATTEPGRSAAGLSAFIVEKGFPGFSVTRTLDKMGLRTSPLGELKFENCEVPAANRLGKEGAGNSIFTHSLSWERGCILASAVGVMERLLQMCIKHSRQRKQFGQAIGKFQLVASKLVDMKLSLETSRLLIYHSAHQRTLGRSAILEAALAKLHVSENWVRCCEHAIQIHGANGYLTEFGIERELRDAVASRLYSGTNEIQRLLVASLLGG